MWYGDDDRYSRRGMFNRRRQNVRETLLLVNARAGERRRDAMHRLGAIVLVLVVLAGTVWVTLAGARLAGRALFSGNSRFTIRRLEITTEGRLQPEHVREYAGLAEGMNLFAVDLAQVRRDLEEVPIVRSVTVRRELPDTLYIDVAARTAAARLGDGSAGYLLALDRDGFILGTTTASPDLPAITGSSEKGLRPGMRVEDPGVRSALRALDLCEAPAMGRLVRIRTVDVSHADYLDLRLARGERVLLSREGLDTKLVKLCEIIQRAADMGRGIAVIDMTVDRNFPVQYQ